MIDNSHAFTRAQARGLRAWIVGENMVADTLLIITSFLAFAFAAATAYLAYRMHKLDMDIPAGRTTALALAILAFNRLVILLSDFGGLPDLTQEALKYTTLSSFFFFILILMYGFWQMKKTFEESVLVERATMDTICNFDKRRQKKLRLLFRKVMRRKKQLIRPALLRKQQQK